MRGQNNEQNSAQDKGDELTELQLSGVASNEPDKPSREVANIVNEEAQQRNHNSA